MKQILLSLDQDKADLLRNEAHEKKTSVQKLIREAIDVYLNKDGFVKLSDEISSKLRWNQSDIEAAVEESIAFWSWGLEESKEDKRIKLVFEDFYDSFKKNRPKIETKMRKVFRRIIKLDYDEANTLEGLMGDQCWMQDDKETEDKLIEYGFDFSFEKEKIIVNIENELLKTKMEKEKIDTHYCFKNRDFPFVIYGEKFTVRFQ